jgi:hypothetical protein
MECTHFLNILTDNGCLFKGKQAANTLLDVLTLNNGTGHILTNSKPLLNDGELDLTFDRWYQAWLHLLDLIKTFLPIKFPLWEVHHIFICDRENWAELWPLYLAYNAEIYRRATQFAINPSVLSISI